MEERWGCSWSTLRSEQLFGRHQHFVGLDGEQAGFRFLAARMVAHTRGVTQHFETRAKGAVAAGVSGAVNADDGFAERTGEMQRACVAGNDE